jgi:ASC-1-like (ASCH) protein
MDLVLPLKRKWFEQIKDGTKKFEYRVYNDFWKKRIEGKTFDRIILTLGYPKKDDDSRRVIRPWRGYTVETINHEEWNYFPEKVFAIMVN